MTAELSALLDVIPPVARENVYSLTASLLLGEIGGKEDAEPKTSQ